MKSSPKGVVVDRVKLEAQVCRDSFHEFFLRFWDVIETRDLVPNWHIKVLCDALQEVAERVFLGQKKEHNLVVNIPPGTTKSRICTVFFPAWVWTRMPSAKVVSISFADSLALDLARASRDLVKSEKFQKLFPEVAVRGDVDAKGFWMNTAGGWRFSSGLRGGPLGKHADFTIIDDPLDPGQAASKAELKSVNDLVSGKLHTRKGDKKTNVTIMIMQRLHQEDPSAVMLANAEKEGGAKVRHFCLPAEFTGSGMSEVRPRKLARRYAPDPARPGTRLLDPIRLDREVLDEAYVSLGADSYAGQFLQVPVVPGGHAFKVAGLNFEDHAPPAADFREVVRYWDKAGTKDGGAYSVGVKMAEDLKGRFWVLHVVRGQWDSAEREDEIKRTARDVDGVRVSVGVEQEGGSGGKESAQGTVRRLAGFRVFVDRPTGDKEVRAVPFSVQVNAGNVYVLRGEWNAAFLDELRFFPRGKYKDQVDACSGAFARLSRQRTRVGGMFPRREGLRPGARQGAETQRRAEVLARGR